MGLQIDMVKKNHEDGSFTMTPIPEAFTGTEALNRFAASFADGPQGPLRIDVDRDDEGQPRMLAGINGPYIRLFARAFRHREQIPGRKASEFPATLLGTVQQVEIGGRTTLRLHPKLQRRFQRSQTPTGPATPVASSPVAKPVSEPKPAAVAPESDELITDEEVPF